MSAINQSQSFYISLESNLNTGWPEGVMVYTQDTQKLWVLQSGTYYQISGSGGTGSSGSTLVQPGSNISTGGTSSQPIVSVVASPSFSNITFSGTAIGGNIQAGSGTFTSLSATTLSGGTIYSATTNLQTTFNTLNSQIVTKASTSGATFTGQITTTALSATTLSGGTIYSGSTNLYSIFALTGSGGASTGVKAGTNTYTGGTFSNPSVNISGASMDNITVSGNTSLQATSASTLSVLNSGTSLSNAVDYNSNTIQTGVVVSNIVGGSGNTVALNTRNIQMIGCLNVSATTSDTTYLNKLKLTPITTLPTAEKGMMFFSGTPLNRIMYNSGGTAADWIII